MVDSEKFLPVEQLKFGCQELIEKWRYSDACNTLA